ncbi:hypothetical protein DFR50_11030 [Roseiarcus fermentans]|uniref:MaoC dehydratase-like protein n=1 Tax=Roseiarcus fermentans TaxID=1473586 RepID=A0A366FHC3_9HYPH|nr:hypothetical protein DFR50_11030 [Roseiarcus fermentans]
MGTLPGAITRRYDASYHLPAAIGFRPRHLKEGIGFADFKATFTCKADLRAGDLFLIQGWIVRTGEKSLTAR